MGAHRDQVATLLPDPPDNLAGRFAVCQFGLGGNASGFELGADFLQVRRVFGDLWTDRIGSVGAGCPCRRQREAAPSGCVRVGRVA